MTSALRTSFLCFTTSILLHGLLNAISWHPVQLGTQQFLVPNEGALYFEYDRGAYFEYVASCDQFSTIHYLTDNGSHEHARLKWGAKKFDEKNAVYYELHQSYKNLPSIHTRYYIYTAHFDFGVRTSTMIEWGPWCIFSGNRVMRTIYSSTGEALEETVYTPHFFSETQLEKRVYSRDPANGLVETLIFDGQENLITRTKFKYNFSGEIIGMYNFNALDQLTSYTTFNRRQEDHTNNCCIEVCDFNAEGQLMSRKLDFYEGDIHVESQHLHPNGEIIRVIGFTYNDIFQLDTIIGMNDQADVEAAISCYYDHMNRIKKINYKSETGAMDDYLYILKKFFNLPGERLSVYCETQKAL